MEHNDQRVSANSSSGFGNVIAEFREQLIEDGKMIDPESVERATENFRNAVKSKNKDKIDQARFDLGYILTNSPERIDNLKASVVLGDLLQELEATPSSSKLKRAELLYFTGLAHFKLGELDDARKLIQSLLRIEPDNTKALILFEVIREDLRKNQEETNRNVGIGLGVAALGIGILAAVLAKSR